MPNLLNQSFRDDPYMREARTYMDAILARTPGYSDTVDPKRNIWGEKVHTPPGMGPEWLSPVSPIIQTFHEGGAQPRTKEWLNSVNADPGDELARQMFMHDTSIQPPPKMLGDLDLTQTYVEGRQYSLHDRYQELHGLVKIRGKTLKEAVAGVIQTRDYQQKLADGDLGVDGGRMKVLRAVFGQYRQAALHTLMRESPEVRQAFEDDKRKRGMYMTQQGQQKLEQMGLK